MEQPPSSPEQGLIAYKVDRVLDETNTDTKILVLSRHDGQSDTFPTWIGAAEGHAIKLALDTTLTPRPMLAPKHPCHAGREASQRFAFGIDQVPFLLHVSWFL